AVRDAKRATQAVAVCTPRFPLEPAPQGWRVLYLSSTNDAVEGAEVYVDGKCQGTIGRHYSQELGLMLRLPPGKYEIMVKKKGFSDFQRTVDVEPSQLPNEKTGKVSVHFDLASKP